MARKTPLSFVLIVATLLVSDAQAQVPTTAQSNALQAAIAAAQKVALRGPRPVPLADEAVLELPVGYVFVPMPEAGQLLRAMGNPAGRELAGAVFTGTDRRARWFVVLIYQLSGHVSEVSTTHWNAEAQLKQVQARAETGGRKVTGWVHVPTYDSVRHRLVWAVATRLPGRTESTVNYNNFALGRRGIVGLDLVTDGAGTRTQARIAHDLLGAVRFKPGDRYEDFDAATDARAPYTVETLVTGVIPRPRPPATRLPYAVALSLLGVSVLLVAAWRARARRRRTLSASADPADRSDRPLP